MFIYHDSLMIFLNDPLTYCITHSWVGWIQKTICLCRHPASSLLCSVTIVVTFSIRFNNVFLFCFMSHLLDQNNYTRTVLHFTGFLKTFWDILIWLWCICFLEHLLSLNVLLNCMGEHNIGIVIFILNNKKAKTMLFAQDII